MEENQCINDSNFTSYIQNNIKILAEGIKVSNTLPVGSVRNNFVTCFPDFIKEIEPYSKQILNMISTLLEKENIKGNIENHDNEEKIDLVVDGVNKILDRVKDNLNEMNGIKSNLPSSSAIQIIKKNISGSWNRDVKKSVKWKANFDGNINANANILQKVQEKPQKKFEDKVDNSDSPFKPNLQLKPNAIKPLSLYLEMSSNNVERYCHPYLHELNCFKVPSCQLEKVEPILPAQLNNNCIVYVDTEEVLTNMMNDLKNENELAIDLEYHSYRSYQGFTCLMQISSRKIDYVIDTLRLRSKLHVLNEIFTDPSVVKVFHGSTSDVLWLQQDLNLYLVNLFDTYLASLTLNFPRLSLAYLLNNYCNVETDKRYQLYDWRIRPLPEAAISYARSDTHYLLYIYDRLRNELIDEGKGRMNLLESVYFRGVNLCKKRYEKYNAENGHLVLYKSSKQTFDNRQMYALEKLYQWRDEVARKEDESVSYVLPNHMLLHIAEILPRETQGILACCNPIPGLVRKNLTHLSKLIHKARSQPVVQISCRTEHSSSSINKIPALSKLRCPHDFSHHDDYRDNLPTLLAGTDVIEFTRSEIKATVTIFDDTAFRRCEEKVKFVSPYERYKQTIAFNVAQAEKENREREESEKQAKDKEDANENVVKKVKIEADLKGPKIVKVKIEPGENETIPSADLIYVPPSENRKRINNEKRKRTQTLSEQVSRKKKAKDYDVIRNAVTTSTEYESIAVDDFPSLEIEKQEIVTTEKSETIITDKDDGTGNKRSKNKKKGKKAFVAFDYTKTNYNKFVTNGKKNLKKLLNSKIVFGSNKKNNKRKIQKRKTTH